MAGRFGVEIDINARGAAAEVDRLIARINGALGKLATGSASPGARRTQRNIVEVEGRARAQQVQEQGGPEEEVKRATAGVTEALRDFDRATKNATEAQRKAAVAAQARLKRREGAFDEQGFRDREREARVTASRSRGMTEGERSDRFFERRTSVARATLDKERRILANEEGILDLIVEARRLRQQQNAYVRRTLAMERRVAAEIQPSTRFQRVQARLSQRGNPESGRVPGDFATLGQFVGQRALVAGAYGIAGAGLYGVINTIQDVIREAEELQRIFVSIESQFEAVGQGDQFEGYRERILEISRNTGVAADQVALLGFQFRGAFGDSARASKELDSAVRGVVVTGLEAREVTDGLTAAALAYGGSVEDIFDKAIGIEERFGVLAKESIAVFGDFSAVAADVGLNITELGAILGTVQQASGRGGAAIAEGLGRVLPTIQEQTTEIFRLYHEIPELRGSLPQIEQSFNTGQTGQVLLQLIRDYDKLNERQQRYVINLLGGRREAQLLIPLFSNQRKIVKELDRDQDDAGKSAQRFADLQVTLSQAIARAREEFRAIGEALFRAGLGDLLRDAAVAGGVLVRVLSLLVGFMADFNELTGGSAGRLLEMAIAIKAVSFGLSQMAKLRAAATAAEVGAAATGGRFSRFLGGGLNAAAMVPGGMRGRFGMAAERYRDATYSQSVAGGPSPRFTQRAQGVGAFAFGGVMPNMAQRYRAQLLDRPTIGARRAGVNAALGGGIGIAALVSADAILIEQVFKALGRVRKDREEGEEIFLDLVKDARAQRLDAARRGKLPGVDVQDDALFRGPGEFAGKVFTSVLNPVAAPVIATRKTGVIGDFLGGAIGFGDLLANRSQSTKLMNEEADARTLQEFNTAVDNGLFSRFNEEQIEALKKRLEKSGGGGKAGQEALRRIGQLNAKENAELERLLEGDRAAAAAALDPGPLFENIERAAEQFQTGEIGYTEYLAALEKERGILKKSAAGRPEAHKDLIKVDKQINDVISNAIVQSAQVTQEFLELAGGGVNAAHPVLAAALRNPKLRDPAARLNIANQLRTIQQRAFEEAIANAPNAQEAQRIAEEGTTLTPELQAFYEEYFKQQGYDVDVSGRIDANPEQIRAVRKRVMQSAILQLQRNNRYNQDPLELALIQQEIARLEFEGAENDEERFQAEMNAADAERAATAARLAVNRSRLALANSRRDDDPLEDARRGIQDAQLVVEDARGQGEAAENAAAEALNAARQTERDVLRDRADAQRELAAAIADEDPIRTAQLELEGADEEMRRAGQDPAARARALASRIRADRTMRDAMRELADAQLELLQTFADIAGNTVEAADIAVRLAEENLNRLVADVRAAGGDPEQSAAVLRSRGELARAQDSAGDARLSEAEAEIEFMMQMGELATAGALERFRGLLALADDPEETRRLLLRIRALENEARTDLQFSLPDLVNIPGLYYQANRLNQFEAQGGGYQDNRTVSASFQINNGMDAETARQWLVDALGAGTRTTTTARRAY